MDNTVSRLDTHIHGKIKKLTKNVSVQDIYLDVKWEKTIDFLFIMPGR